MLAAAPPDDHVLNMLLLVLKPAQRAADLTAAYEAACSKQPNNQDLLEGLFACHVRCVVLLQQHISNARTRSDSLAGAFAGRQSLGR